MTGTIQQIDTAVNLAQALLWQYNEATSLQSLILQKQTWYNQSQSGFWNDWYTDVFNLKTANYFGLSVWAIILNQPIIFNNVGDPDKVSWGFGTYHANFTRGNFSSKDGFSFQLSAESARIILRIQQYKVIGVCCVPEINRMLADVFADYGKAFLVDNHDMTQNYYFTFSLPTDLRFIFSKADILPRPAGVKSSFSEEVFQSFGFGENHQNFTNGNFYDY